MTDKKKVGTFVKFKDYLDNDQYSKFEEFKTWLHYDKLKKKSR